VSSFSLNRWAALWRAAGASGDPGAPYQSLHACYSGPGRFYHNLRHLADCLEEFDTAKHLASNPTAVELALVFHDAVYDSRAPDNEERSAEMATKMLSAARAAPNLCAEVSRLILATRHVAASVTDDAALVVDIDLTILGQPGRRFDEYEQDIRQEYSWVPPEVFALKRAEILRRFLERERIYATDFFGRKYEQSARKNLAASLKKLAEAQPPR
jgi:predicted metal-dependent HD superfamily phosphohydrolase